MYDSSSCSHGIVLLETLLVNVEYDANLLTCTRKLQRIVEFSWRNCRTSWKTYGNNFCKRVGTCMIAYFDAAIVYF